MLCEKCNKNTANVVFTKVENGHKTVQRLCQECMQEEESSFSFPFLGIPKNFSNLFVDQRERAPEVKCDRCGMTWSQFQKGGELGCADCYNAFRAQLMPVLKRAHGNAKHAGKLPRCASEEAKKNGRLEDLRNELNRAVTGEEYEKAAQLRDAIRALEGGDEATQEKEAPTPKKAPKKRSPRKTTAAEKGGEQDA